jgi:hypothetical protein
MHAHVCGGLAWKVSPPFRGRGRGAPGESPLGVGVCAPPREGPTMAPPARWPCPPHRGPDEPPTCLAMGESRETPSGRDRRLHRELPTWGSSRGGPVLALPRQMTPRQQLGRARDRDWAGGTGRAGWSRAGTRLAGFFIGSILSASHSERNSHQTIAARRSIANSTAKSSTFHRIC